MRHRARRDVVPAWLPRSRSYSEGVRAGIESYRKHRRVMSPPSGEPSFVRGFLDGEAHARSRHDPTKKQKRVSPHPGANPRTLKEFGEEVHALLLVKGLTESQARRLLRRWGRTVKYAWESGRPPCWTSDHLMKYDLRPDLSPRRKSSRDPSKVLDPSKALDGDAVAFFYVGGDEKEGDPESITLHKDDVPLEVVKRYLMRRLGEGAQVSAHRDRLFCKAKGYGGKLYSYTTPVKVEARRSPSSR